MSRISAHSIHKPGFLIVCRTATTNIKVSSDLNPAQINFTSLALVSSCAYSMFFYTIKTSGPVPASQCAYVVTISSVIWGIVLFSEQHTLWVWSSVVVMIFGLALVTPSRNPDKESEVEVVVTETSQQ